MDLHNAFRGMIFGSGAEWAVGSLQLAVCSWQLAVGQLAETIESTVWRRWLQSADCLLLMPTAYSDSASIYCKPQQGCSFKHL